jgi:hypothetical protein
VLPAEDDRQEMRRRERKGVWRGGVQRRFGCLFVGLEREESGRATMVGGAN